MVSSGHAGTSGDPQPCVEAAIRSRPHSAGRTVPARRARADCGRAAFRHPRPCERMGPDGGRGRTGRRALEDDGLHTLATSDFLARGRGVTVMPPSRPPRGSSARRTALSRPYRRWRATGDGARRNRRHDRSGNRGPYRPPGPSKGRRQLRIRDITRNRPHWRSRCTSWRREARRGAAFRSARRSPRTCLRYRDRCASGRLQSARSP